MTVQGLFYPVIGIVYYQLSELSIIGHIDVLVRSVINCAHTPFSGVFL